MENTEKCALAICSCVARLGDSYCSDYCQQAATHGTEKDFCQCAHGSCTSIRETASHGGIKLPHSIQVTGGRVTIEFRNSEHLREQVILLAAALDQDPGAFEAVEKLSPRRPPHSERESARANAGSA